MFGCYRTGDANDPETYTAAVAAVLAEYSPEVVCAVTDPRKGLPRKLKWLPSVAEVAEACEQENRYWIRTRPQPVALAHREPWEDAPVDPKMVERFNNLVAFLRGKRSEP
jgi:hypothetical protein